MSGYRPVDQEITEFENINMYIEVAVDDLKLKIWEGEYTYALSILEEIKDHLHEAIRLQKYE